MSTLTRNSRTKGGPRLHGVACVLAVAVLTACASRMDGAPVVDRSGGAGGTGDLATQQATGPAPAGFYRVKPGDTLYRIALENGQNYRDIAGWNNLTNPNAIEVGQLLRVAPPGAAGAPGGVTTTPLASSGVQSAPLGAAPAYVPPPPVGATGSTPPPLASNPPDAGAAVANSAPMGTGPVTLSWPARGPILARFDGGKNKGVDIGGTAGEPVLAAGEGRVLYAGSGLRGYGNLIIIKHNDTLLTAYAHNQTLLVKEGDAVTRGQKIAEMGSSGTDRVKLHFEVRKQTKPVDPLSYLPPQ
ncbi:peptidoglycan DD-metalloendopeptidase family protein [Chitinasiproducens palmae]|uniref:Lipoprotein NlpD n=1 Tax=Chitinasiproducens palmae TaxID=1770053 RepID=A0A1H2PVU0_9BURK|nr:peptidoglycan DD-metalloendopeptidase family protein [Chitinasiproducens palmae]SDV51428.1 lipoprotein NlpD [Chitinasiproducens palmae]